MRAFPKIFAIGTDYIKDIFKHNVEVTEKIDGSQFGFGLFDGKLFLRSKGATIYADNPEKMFSLGINYIVSIQYKLPEGVMFYAEYLKTPSHNTLKYNRVPQNNLILFGASDRSEFFVSDYSQLQTYAELLEIEIVPLIYQGSIKSPDFLMDLLERESILGGAQVEGVVVKNYEAKFLLGGQPMPLMAGKFVSEKFKEVHRGWNKEHTGKGKWETFKDAFKTEARWQKAIQHLAEKGELTNTPQDIGKLLKEIKDDIAAEEQETIKVFLWKEFGTEVLRHATIGFAEWYKEKLMERSFEKETP